MDFKFIDGSTDLSEIVLKDSSLIHPCLLENNKNDLIKAIDFINSEEKFLYVHGFLGTGKRQFVNYLCEYLARDVIKLEYYCKEATVCDDILLDFTQKIETHSISKSINVNAKITTLGAKFLKYLSSIKKPFLIILHSLDNISEDNLQYISKIFSDALKEPNVKIIITTRAMKQNLLGDLDEDRKVFLKAFTKDIFKKYLEINTIIGSEKQIEDFYSLTRGYYFYTAISVKIIQAMKVGLGEFIQKVKAAEVSFDSFIGETYINLIPNAIRNFFWFLRAIRHGVSLNALAVLDIYDEFSIQYLISNMIVFQSEETLYLHDYFVQKIDIILPQQTAIKLHKYIINIYENLLKESLADRTILISRQALRAEIDFHSNCIKEVEEGKDNQSQDISINTPEQSSLSNQKEKQSVKNLTNLTGMIDEAVKLASDKKTTEAIEAFSKLLDNDKLDSASLIEIRLNLARLYNEIENYNNSMHYYELVETYYKHNKELINLNYLYYEMTDLYYKMYKHERAIDTIKKVIYSVDTPQSLMVSACTLLGNIYSDMNSPENAFSYYQKALDSLDVNVEDSVLSELYFKFALANDEKGDIKLAFEYYSRCISISHDNKYLASAYSNIASCYYESGNDDDALDCFFKAYNIEKSNNNYDGIFYTASHIAKILIKNDKEETLKFLLEAKQSADFINEGFYMVEASTALGDYYYSIPEKWKDALTEYYRAKQTAENSSESIDVSVINRRINDMKFRMKEADFKEIQKKYERES